MSGFVSRYTNRIDRKGRVSVPASFRQVLARESFEGLYCYPSLDMQAVDAGGTGLLARIDAHLSRYQPFTEEHDFLSTAFYGLSERLVMDGEGRVGLTASLLEATGITEEVTFVGQGYKFQIWEPTRYLDHEAEARRRAQALRRGPRTGPAGEGA
jgi:MraZ protein